MENRALQMLTAGPWNAINKDLLMQLTDIGYKVEAASIMTMSKAAMFRFTHQSNVFFKCVDMIERAKKDDDDVILSPALAKWHRNAHITMLHKNWAELHSIPAIASPTSIEHVQAHVSAVVRKSQFKKSANDILEARIRYWILDITQAKVHRMLRRFAYIAKTLPPFLATAVLKSITNCWCTSARFHETLLPCRMCAAPNGDTLRHYIVCPRILQALAVNVPKLHQHWGNPDHPLTGFLLLGSLREKDQLLGIALAHDAILTSLNTVRARSQSPTEAELTSMFKARLRKQALKDACARAVLQRIG
jgi:hypothetical protein